MLSCTINSGGDVIPVSVSLSKRPTRRVRQCRALVLGVGLVALAIKLLLASVTFGTNDIFHWKEFAKGVRQAGPLGVYRLHFSTVFNHPPLIPYFLVGVNFLTHFGLPLKFTIRAVASLADVVSALLVFAVLQRRRSLREATAAGVSVAASPVLITVSGFHGNTDPLFTMLTLLSLFLLADRRKPLAAGVVLAVALSVKVVPVVAVPALLVYASTRGRDTLVRFAGGLAAVGLIIWAPAVLREWGPIRHDVLGYSGLRVHPWGLPQFTQWLHLPRLSNWLARSTRLPVVICAVLPAIAVWRKPRFVAEATGISMAAFFALSPAFGVQYLVWPLLFLYLMSFTWATAYNLLAGGLLVEVYTRWDGTFLWNRAHATGLLQSERVWAALVWLALVAAIGRGISRIFGGAGMHARGPIPGPGSGIGLRSSAVPMGQEALDSAD
jgi:Dolichyl-phosphate-mannose-protein mannosyltransferase